MVWREFQDFEKSEDDYMYSYIKNYELTSPGKTLLKEIKERIQSKKISSLQGRVVIQNAAWFYFEQVNNSWNWAEDELLVLINELPVLFSLIDVVTCRDSFIKSIFLIPTKNTEEVKSIFQSKNEKYSNFKWRCNNNDLELFCHIELSVEEGGYFEKLKFTGQDIFNEIVDRKIAVGYYQCSSDTPPILSEYPNIFSTFTSLGINKRIPSNKTGYREDMGSGFRSAWEANIARLLTYNNIEWSYETKSYRIEGKTKGSYYFPDFFLKNNILLEVKGFWDNDSRQKVMLFSEQYPDYRLMLIDSDIYFDLDNEYKAIIPNWENTPVNKPCFHIPVVGINQASRRLLIDALSIGDHLNLIRDPQNQYDKNAIIVANKLDQQVGFVSKDWACIIAPKMDLGCEYTTVIKSIEPNVIWLNVMRSNFDKTIIPGYLLT